MKEKITCTIGNYVIKVHVFRLVCVTTHVDSDATVPTYEPAIEYAVGLLRTFAQLITAPL